MIAVSYLSVRFAPGTTLRIYSNYLVLTSLESRYHYYYLCLPAAWERGRNGVRARERLICSDFSCRIGKLTFQSWDNGHAWPEDSIDLMPALHPVPEPSSLAGTALISIPQLQKPTWKEAPWFVHKITQPRPRTCARPSPLPTVGWMHLPRRAGPEAGKWDSAGPGDDGLAEGGARLPASLPKETSEGPVI